MKTFITIAAMFALFFGLQLMNITALLIPDRTQNFMEAGSYTPPNQGGPNRSMGSGTR